MATIYDNIKGTQTDTVTGKVTYSKTGFKKESPITKKATPTAKMTNKQKDDYVEFLRLKNKGRFEKEIELIKKHGNNAKLPKKSK